MGASDSDALVLQVIKVSTLLHRGSASTSLQLQIPLSAFQAFDSDPLWFVDRNFSADDLERHRKCISGCLSPDLCSILGDPLVHTKVIR